MRTPEALETLVDYGIVEEVLRPLMSGKEAQIYLVRSGGELRVAKIYKDAEQRSFKQRAEYTEGRTTRNTRDRRAMAKHSRHGKAQDEAAWRSAEVNAIYRLSEAGVRVPTPFHFIDGVLVMELVVDHEGQPAPRLGDVVYAPEVARRIFEMLLAAVVRMLCAGVVHGDLSEFNVLMAADGPVVIDFPQAVDPANNSAARKLLIRDVDNLHRFMARYFRGYRALPYAQEMWELYQQNLLTPDTVLRGRVSMSQRPANTADVLALIGDAEREQRRRTGGGQHRGSGQGAARGSGQGPQGGAQGGPVSGPRGPKVEVVMPRGVGARGNEPRSQGSRSQEPRGDGARSQGARSQGSPEEQGPRGDGARSQGSRGDGARSWQRNEPQGPQRSEPRGSQRSEPRGPQRSEPRSPQRSEPRGSQPNEPRSPGPRGAGDGPRSHEGPGRSQGRPGEAAQQGRPGEGQALGDDAGGGRRRRRRSGGASQGSSSSP